MREGSSKKLRSNQVWLKRLSLLLVAVLLVWLAYSKLRVNELYQNFQVTQEAITKKDYTRISQKLEIKALREQVTRKKYSATFLVKAKGACKLSLSQFYLYRGNKEAVDQFTDAKVDGQNSEHLKKGINQVTITTDPPEGQTAVLYLLANPECGKFIKYQFKFS